MSKNEYNELNDKLLELNGECCHDWECYPQSGGMRYYCRKKCGAAYYEPNPPEVGDGRDIRVQEIFKICEKYCYYYHIEIEYDCNYKIILTIKEKRDDNISIHIRTGNYIKEVIGNAIVSALYNKYIDKE